MPKPKSFVKKMEQDSINSKLDTNNSNSISNHKNSMNDFKSYISNNKNDNNNNIKTNNYKQNSKIKKFNSFEEGNLKKNITNEVNRFQLPIPGLTPNLKKFLVYSNFIPVLTLPCPLQNKIVYIIIVSILL